MRHMASLIASGVLGLVRRFLEKSFESESGYRCMHH